MDITSLLQSALSQGASDQVAKKTGLSQDQIAQGMELLSGLFSHQVAKNTATKKGAEDFYNALDKHPEDDGKFDMADAAKIVGHIFGSKQDQVATAVGKEIGADSSQSSALMKMAASMFMKQLGQEKQSGGLDLSSIIGMVTSSAQSAKKNNSMLDKVLVMALDKDGDGDYKDDLLSKIVGFFTGRNKA